MTFIARNGRRLKSCPENNLEMILPQVVLILLRFARVLWWLAVILSHNCFRAKTLLHYDSHFRL